MSAIGVLVVDDDFRVARIHAEYLERVPGFSVLGLAHTATAAEQAVAELRPDLVLLDLYLPDEHGLSLVGRLRDGPGPSPDIIAITAARDVATVRSALQVGVVHYLVKPFRFDTLRQRLIGYRTWAEEARHLDEADQGDVDTSSSFFAATRPPPCRRVTPSRPWPWSGAPLPTMTPTSVPRRWPATWGCRGPPSTGT